MTAKNHDKVDIFLIAREAKVSIATVSRVLNNTQAVTGDKKRAIYKARIPAYGT